GGEQDDTEDQCRDDRRGDLPVIADDEVVQEPVDGPNDPHATGSFRAAGGWADARATRGSTTTSRRDSTSQPPRRISSAQSPPGQARLVPPCTAPRPSSAQNVP